MAGNIAAGLVKNKGGSGNNDVAVDAVDIAILIEDKVRGVVERMI
jgi:hypothetical protein